MGCTNIKPSVPPTLQTNPPSPSNNQAHKQSSTRFPFSFALKSDDESSTPRTFNLPNELNLKSNNFNPQSGEAVTYLSDYKPLTFSLQPTKFQQTHQLVVSNQTIQKQQKSQDANSQSSEAHQEISARKVEEEKGNVSIDSTPELANEKLSPEQENRLAVLISPNYRMINQQPHSRNSYQISHSNKERKHLALPEPILASKQLHQKTQDMQIKKVLSLNVLDSRQNLVDNELGFLKVNNIQYDIAIKEDLECFQQNSSRRSTNFNEITIEEIEKDFKRNPNRPLTQFSMFTLRNIPFK